MNIFSELKGKLLDCKFFIHASKGPIVIMKKLKFIYNNPFKD